MLVSQTGSQYAKLPMEINLNQQDLEARRPSERVAVITVHGVGDPELGETAERVVAQLQRRQIGDGNTYTAFNKTSIEIPVWTIPIPPYANINDDIAFSIKSIEEVIATDEVGRFSTFCYSGTRIDSVQQKIDVDVYDMYWGDFSRAPSLFARYFGELYQLYFHLATLGRNAIRDALQQSIREGQKSTFLVGLYSFHRILAWLLPTSIPMFNLFMIVPAVPLFVGLLDENGTVAPLLAVITTGISIFVLLVALFYRTGFRYGGGIAVLLTIAVGYFLMPIIILQPRLILGCAAMLMGLTAVLIATRQLLTSYGSSTLKWAPWLAMILLVAFFMLALCSQWNAPTTAFGLMILTSMWVVHLEFFILQCLWSVVFGLLLLICLLPYAAKHLPTPFRHAMNTGRIGALISATLFLVTTLVAWAVLLGILGKFIDAASKELPAYVSGIPILHRNVFNNECQNFGIATINVSQTVLTDYTTCLMNLFTGYHANSFLALIGVALLLGVTSILPSAWYESKPPEPDQATSEKETTRLSDWLNASRVIFPIAEGLLILAWIMQILGYVAPVKAFIANTWVQQVGTLLGAGFVGAAFPLLVLFRTQLPKAASAVLDILLDVSNWLRERPYASNPRGRILLRYTALLHCVLESCDYDRIVIVCHSQGTVISADFLRLMQQLNIWPYHKDRRPEICLFTVGCPLSQLYAQRFPVWYAWGNHPDPNSLGVRIWVNAYRSGDYVGRGLWGGQALTQECLNWDPRNRHIETSIGAGAHTHYFDHTAPKVSKIIDWLVAGDPMSYTSTR